MQIMTLLCFCIYHNKSLACVQLTFAGFIQKREKNGSILQAVIGRDLCLFQIMDTGGLRQNKITSLLLTFFVPISESLPNKSLSLQFYLSSRISRSRVSVRQWYVIHKISNGLFLTYPSFMEFSWCTCYSGCEL